MPYADPEKRREFDRERKRRQRAEAGVSTRNPAQMVKGYICLQVPQLRLPGGISFRHGFFVTADPKQQAMIEGDPAYGTDIFSWELSS